MDDNAVEEAAVMEDHCLAEKLEGGWVVVRKSPIVIEPVSFSFLVMTFPASFVIETSSEWHSAEGSRLGATQGIVICHKF